ncbi:MAG: FkbM family methyltransferase [Bdellovibrionales bacterium]|nr:FkbM family methyltransferase [Bdellovibrionales bacterium]
MLKKLFKKFQDKGIGGVLASLQRKVFPAKAPQSPVQRCLPEVLKKEDFVIVQIGAYVGNSDNDPLFHALTSQTFLHNSKSHKLVFVEPVKEYYDRLVENYSCLTQASFENVAISDHDGPATFFRLGVDPVAYGYPEWLSQISSLKEERSGSMWEQYDGHANEKEIQEFYLKHRIQTEVNCITFEMLLERHSISHIDLLQIDVEGFEFEILRSIDFNKIPIRFINYESTLLFDNKEACEQMLGALGYSFLDFSQDTFCFRKDDQGLFC